MNDLNLALIGNCTIGALVNRHAEIVWGCFPRFDGDAIFNALLQEDPAAPGTRGIWGIELLDLEHTEQYYVTHTAVLVMHARDKHGGIVEVTDFAPRFKHHSRIFCPMMIVRRLKRIAGSPRLRVRLRTSGWSGESVKTTHGSNHIRYLTPNLVLRLTTDISVTAVLQEIPFLLNDEANLLLGPDETVAIGMHEVCRRYEQETTDYWRDWVRSLAIPFEWQEVVIRAAISLKQNAFEDTGAIIAAMTSSIPEANDDSGRNWDYRFCWLRDAYFTVNALNSLSTTLTMEQYLGYIINLVASSPEGQLQPVYGIDGRALLTEEIVSTLPGYRGIGPVRIGNQAYQQVQNDVYGSAVLAVAHVFFDRRMHRRDLPSLFRHLEKLGEMSRMVYNQPDAGLWELRGTSKVHTFSAVMCWAACDRLARIAAHIGLGSRAGYWRTHADRMRNEILEQAWNEKYHALGATFGGGGVDASMLLLPELMFISPQDPRFLGTVKLVEEELRRGDYVFRYSEPDDFGVPQNAFLVCTFWYIDALAATGRKEEARALFANLVAKRNPHGLLAEHIDTQTSELWGNFVQTYSMVGFINSATRLSIPWDEAF
jgi:GH15 family glucan-1,4-alpha-glucosidase